MPQCKTALSPLLMHQRYCSPAKKHWFELQVNSLWPSDVIWWQGSRSTLAQVMAHCLTAPSHYLNQCWLIISKAQYHSSEGNSTKDTSAIKHKKIAWKLLIKKFHLILPGANELMCTIGYRNYILHHVMDPFLLSVHCYTVDGFVTERHNSNANAVELRLFITNPSQLHPALCKTQWSVSVKEIWPQCLNKWVISLFPLTNHQSLKIVETILSGAGNQKYEFCGIMLLQTM